MPGFTTHYLFGLNTYKKLNNLPIKKTIYEHHTAYALGLQGPDLYFYFLPSYLMHSDNIGSIAHEKHTGKFLSHLLDSRKLFSTSREREIADAYISGYLGHYILDTYCHPYIYWKTDFEKKSSQYYGNHMELESTIDTELLYFYKKLPISQFREEATIMLNRLELHTIAVILHYTYSKTYPELHTSNSFMRISIRSMQIGTRFLHDSSGRKKAFLRKLEKWTLGYPLLSSMVPEDYPNNHPDPLNLLHKQWYNPWNKEFHSTNSFFDLLEASQAYYTSVLIQLSDIFFSHFSSPAPLLKRLGNNSYHSGLDLNFPG